MPGNSFGELFTITTFGESHGGGVGVVIDGCPPNVPITQEEIQIELERRRPGQSAITTQRKEEDKIQILSGVFDGLTTGTPILLLAHNKDQRPEDYIQLKNLYRPGHADYTFQMKYGIRDWMGSGRASARETLGRVAAGAIAKKYLRVTLGVEILSYVEQVGDIKTEIDFNTVTPEQIEANIVRCPDEMIAQKMIERIEHVRDDGDSIGGIVRGVIKNTPKGLGEPVFNKLPAYLAHAMMSINAVKGFEIGSGFEGVSKLGSKHNDPFFIDDSGEVRTKTNNAGGTLGGISNGETIYFRVAIKPVSTIKKGQQTVSVDKKPQTLSATGRHDPCVLPRVIPIIDAMSALVLLDLFLIHKAQNT